MDMDTVGSVTPGGAVQDVEIGLYNAIGQLRDEDDDSGPGLWSQLSFGGTTARPALPAEPPATTAGLIRGGGDGTLAAGRYYAVVADFSATFSPRFIFTNGVDAGQMAINLRTNMTGGGGSGPSSPCGPADIAGGGAAPGADNFLDNNDFIFYIQLFFASDPAADIASGGASPGSDGFWDNNDFILFIQNFFDGGAASGCNGNP
jgi:hypothetical protein